MTNLQKPRGSKERNRQNDQGSFINQTVRRIDGEEVVRKYSKCGLLGKGGFANCFVTENIQTGRRLATKIVLKDQLKSQRTKLRLANQIRLHKTLHHPNVVGFEHYFEDKDNVYIFLQLCDNQSLNELLRVRGNFLTPQIQSFLYGIINGVEYIHSRQIIHRDLKLGNIFVDGKLNIKIGDFGLATKLEFLNQYKRTVCGTPNYIAPEILEGKGYHFEVDIWSIGVILYTLYFSYPPFETDDANATYQRIKECNYSIPKLPLVPPEAISLIQRILVRDPSRRPTLQQLLESDFMKLGQGILKELPPICARKAPNKKELSLNGTLIAHKQIPKQQPPQNNNDLPKNYILQFEELLEGTFYYRLQSQIHGVFRQGQPVIYRNLSGQYVKINPESKGQEPAGDCNLKYLLMGKQKRFNVLDSCIRPGQKNDPVYIKKVRKNCSTTLVRLSNGSIQILFEDNGNYLLRKDQRVFQIGTKVNEIGIIKIMSCRKESFKVNYQHIKCLKALILEIRYRKQEAMELNEREELEGENFE